MNIISNIVGLKNIVESGFSLAKEKTFLERKQICDSCNFWNSSAFSGIGKCLKCGCSGYKLKMAASICPEGKWGAEHIDNKNH